MCIDKKWIAKAGFHVPCGKCYPCIKRKITDWSTRLHFEEMYSRTKPLFLTLTYSNENLKFPAPRARFATLCKRDLQTFFKRLRKISSRRSDYRNDIRYLAVGEYGTTNKRPHYHILVFNAHDQDCHNAWKLNGKEIGEIYYGDISSRSIAYVVGYAIAQKSNRTHVLRNHLIPEFHLYSNGLGKIYTTRTATIHHNQRILCGDPAHYIMVDGVKRPMPRYYIDKIYTPQNKKLLKLQLQAIADAKSQLLLTENQLKDAKRESDRKLSQRRKSAVA